MTQAELQAAVEEGVRRALKEGGPCLCSTIIEGQCQLSLHDRIENHVWVKEFRGDMQTARRSAVKAVVAVILAALAIGLSILIRRPVG